MCVWENAKGFGNNMIIICENCGKKVDKKVNKESKHLFCSIKCAYEWRKNNPEWLKKMHNRPKRKRKLNKYVAKGDTTIVITTKGEEIIIDSEDFNKIKDYTWRVNNNGYAITEFTESVNKIKMIQMHRLINNTPANKITDHKNGNRLDNRKTNLRDCNYSENARNCKTPSTSSSGIAGVQYAKREKRWRARIYTDGKEISLGYYETKEEAILARMNGEQEYFGEFSPSLRRKDI
ncbi:MAG: AP2 domain-containing protein [Clostridium sp.]|uniref:hypothetical protein n=1 Tax=Clostridium sp. TaxID=1506 RepID=UPI0039ED790E